MASTAPAKVVAAFYEALARGDVATARDCWADDAVWHATGQSDLAGDYEPDAYFAMLGEWAARYPEYDFTSSEVGEFDDSAVFFIESTGGMAPGSASGLMVYRVTAGKIAEGWAIPAFGDGRYLF
jgi:ketosteroid isomerase-like protein